jgi:hypothetical protein
VSGEPLRNQIHRELVNRPFQFQKRGQLFIGMHNETLSVTVRVNNPDGSRHQAKTPLNLTTKNGRNRLATTLFVLALA